MPIKIDEAKKEYLFFSSEISKLNRQLSFAGIAVIWIFRGEAGGLLNVPRGLLLPLILFVASLFVDFLYYLLAATHLNILLLKSDRKRKPPKTVDYPGRSGPWIYNILYYLKFLPLAVGYVCILFYMGGRYF